MLKDKNLLQTSVILILSPLLILAIISFMADIDLILFFKFINMIILFVIIFYNINNRIIFNPKMYMMVFIFVAVFSTFELCNQIEKWNYLMYLIILVAAVSYLLPCFILIRDKGKLTLKRKKLKKNEIIKISTIFIIISFIASTYEFYKFGNIPLFTKNLEVVRFNVRVSGYIHILSILSRIVMIIIGSYWIGENKVDYKNEKILIFNFVLAFTLLLFTGFRGEIIVPIAILVIQYFLINKINYKILGISLVFVILVLGVWPIFRKMSSYGYVYIDNLKRISNYPKLFFLTPLYSTFAMNFEILRKLTVTFPSVVNYGKGYYTFLQPFSVIIPGIKLPSLYDVQNLVWGTGFYSGLTSTYIGSLYADGGLFFVFMFNLFLGIIISLIYNYMIKVNRWPVIGIYSYLYYLIFLGIYSSGITIDNIFYIVILYLSYKLCEVKKDA